MGNSASFEINVPGAVDDKAWRTDKLSQEEQDRKAEIDSVLDPAVSMSQRRDTKDLSLDEIKARDEDNLRLIQANCYRKPFNTMLEAIFYVQECIRTALNRMGVWHLPKKGLPWVDFYQAMTVIPGNLFRPGQPTSRFAMECIKNDVRLEIRHMDQYDEGEKWKAGAYLYHKSEIAYWVGLPELKLNSTSPNGNIVVITKEPQKFYVRTNVRVM